MGRAASRQPRPIMRNSSRATRQGAPTRALGWSVALTLLSGAGCVGGLGTHPDDGAPSADPRGPADGRLLADGAVAEDPPLWPIPSLRLPEPPPAEEEETDTAPVEPLIRIQLADGPTPGPAATPAEALPAPEPLSRIRVEALLARLPPPADDAPQDPAPETPAPDPTDPVEPAPLEPLRVHSVLPVGTTDVAPHVTVSFSDAMVPLGADGEPLAGEPPVHLDPSPPGRWRWLDVRTLRFEPAAGRLPGATTYTVRVSPGTRSARGAELPDGVTARFATRGAIAVGGWPRAEIVDLDPLILLVFDQRVEPADVLAAARLLADSVLHPLRLVDPAELDEEPRLAAAVDQAPEGRWVAFRPERPLPPAAEIRLKLGPELRSAEGPDPTGRPQQLVFFSRRAMELDEARCTDPDGPCSPDRWWWATFSNPLDPESVTADRVRFEPRVDDVRVWTAGRRIWVAGDFLPHRSYRVTLAGEIRDRFGHRLGESLELDLHFGPPSSALRVRGAPFVTLDPREPPRIEVDTRAVPEVLVEIFRVGPEDWGAFLDFLYPDPRDPEPEDPPGTRVSQTRVQPPDGGWGFSRVGVELGAALQNGAGHAIVRVSEARPEGQDPRETSVAWIQATRLGLEVVWDTRRVTARAQSLLDGTPLADAQVRLPASGISGRTGPEGFVTLALQETRDSLLVLEAGGETAILPQSGGATRRQGAWALDRAHPTAAWAAFTDRGLYRPGEEGRIHGWIREREPGSEVGPGLPASVDSVRYRIQWPRPGRGRSTSAPQALEATVPVSPLGAFHVAFQVPERAHAGRASVTLHAEGGDISPDWWRTNVGFQVEEFRRPEYQVTVESEPDVRFADDPLDVRVDARYFDGPPLLGAEVSWWVGPSLAAHVPTGWRGWVFSADSRSRPDGPGEREAAVATMETRTDGEGVHRLRIAADNPLPPFPVALDVRAEVRDLDRQAGSDGTRILLHPGSAYAGFRVDNRTLVEGDTLTFQVVVLDPEGEPVPGLAPRVRIERMEARAPSSPGRADPLDVRDAWVPACEEVIVEGPEDLEVPGLRCRHPTSEEGLLRLSAEVDDVRGRRARSEQVLTVRPVRRGGLAFFGPAGPAAGDRLEVGFHQDLYEPGDTAHLWVSSPVHPAHGTVTVVHNGIRQVVPLSLDGPETKLALPVGEGQLGRSQVQVALTAPDRPDRPLRAATSLHVSAEHRRLEVHAEAEVAEAEPGQEVPVRVTVRDARGHPVVDGEVTLWLVDEAVLALARYRMPDPLGQLTPPAWTPTGRRHLTDLVRWSRRARGPGWLTGRLVNGATGGALFGHTVRIPDLGREVRTALSGEFALDDVPGGTHLVEVLIRDEVVDRREVLVAALGTDLGELLVVEPPRPPPLPEQGAPPGFDSLRAFEPRGPAQGVRLRAREVTVAPASVEGTRMPTLSSLAIEPPSPDWGPATLRESFGALAAFEAVLRTDGEGRASTQVRLPDTVTRYRILAVAVRGAGEFGTGEGELVARRDFLVRPAFPRFMHPGDRGELSILVQNLTDRDGEVEVAARAAGLELEGTGGVRLTVPAGDRREVRLPARALSVGEARVDAVAAMAREVDAVGVTIPVHPALAPRSVALYARLDEGDHLRLPVEVPPGILPGFGEVEVALSTSILQSLTDELLLLFREPDLGPDATVARLMGAAAVHDRFELLGSDALPPASQLQEQVAEDIRFLAEAYSPWQMRLGSTPPPHWRGLDGLSVLTALDGALALQRAARAGFEVPESLLWDVGRTAHERLQWLILRLNERGEPPGRYALYRVAYTGYVVRELTGGVPPQLVQWASALAPDDLPSESLAWLYATLIRIQGADSLAEGFRAALLNRVLVEGGTATFRTGPSATVPASAPGEERLLFASTRRTDAVVLSALLQVEPDLPMLPAVARGLVGHRDAAGFEAVWCSIFEAGWLLMALGEYTRIREEEVPDLTVQARLDDGPLADEIFRGRSLRTARASVPVGRLTATDGGEGGRASLLSVQRSGTGALYVRAGVRYAPADPFQPPEDRGFVVARRYEAVDDPGDVRRDADGTWRIRAGARVRVRVTLAATARRYQVRLRDPLPAGVEVINPRLEGALLPAPDEQAPGNSPVAAPPCSIFLRDGAHPATAWANWTECMVHSRFAMGQPWHTYRELRSDRMEAHASILPAGTFETTYLVRATIPGSFVAAPAEVWEARHPETRGRGEADRVVVVEEAGGR